MTVSSPTPVLTPPPDERVSHERHLALKQEGHTTAQAETAARAIRAELGDATLGPYTDFDGGYLNGQLSALQCMLGDDWDTLDTRTCFTKRVGSAGR